MQKLVPSYCVNVCTAGVLRASEALMTEPRAKPETKLYGKRMFGKKKLPIVVLFL